MNDVLAASSVVEDWPFPFGEGKERKKLPEWAEDCNHNPNRINCRLYRREMFRKLEWAATTKQLYYHFLATSCPPHASGNSSEL